jgi:hypothetical protein
MNETLKKFWGEFECFGINPTEEGFQYTVSLDDDGSEMSLCYSFAEGNFSEDIESFADAVREGCDWGDDYMETISRNVNEAVFGSSLVRDFCSDKETAETAKRVHDGLLSLSFAFD